MSSTLVGLDGTNENSSLPHIREFKVEDVSFINSSIAKSIDDDLMFNDGSKIPEQPGRLTSIEIMHYEKRSLIFFNFNPTSQAFLLIN
jgi:hypothetical protein